MAKDVMICRNRLVVMAAMGLKGPFEYNRLSTPGAFAQYRTLPFSLGGGGDGQPVDAGAETEGGCRRDQMEPGWYTWEAGQFSETYRKEEGDDVNDFDRFARAGFTILPPL